MQLHISSVRKNRQNNLSHQEFSKDFRKQIYLISNIKLRNKSRFIFAENTISNLPKIMRFKFL